MDVKFKLSDELYITTMSYDDGIIKVNRLEIGVTDKAMTAIFHTANGRFSRDIVAVEGDEVMITECDNHLWVSTSYEDAREKFVNKFKLKTFREYNGVYVQAVKVENFEAISNRFEMKKVGDAYVFVKMGQDSVVVEVSDDRMDEYVLKVSTNDGVWRLFANDVEARSFEYNVNRGLKGCEEKFDMALFTYNLTKGGEE